jgi:glutamine amidotransferase
MFYLALTFGLEEDPLGAVARMAGCVEKLGRAHGVDESLWMTLGFSEGEKIYAVRYASDGNAPTLYHSRHMDDMVRLNPVLEGLFSPTARAVVSEPLGNIAEAWVQVPQNTAVVVQEGVVTYQPFSPQPPA